MAAPALDLAEPTFSSAVDAAQDAIRDNQIWIVIALGNAGIIVPGWNATPTGADLSKPDTVVMTGPGGRKIRMTYSYTGDDVTGIVVAYDKNLGAGYETLASGTATLTYDGSGNWSGSTWA